MCGYHRCSCSLANLIFVLTSLQKEIIRCLFRSPMPKARKRKAPITGIGTTSDTNSSKSESSRAVIRRFHVLLKQQTQLQKSIIQDISKKTELADVEREIRELGGLESYQRMSVIGQGTDRGGGSEKVLIRWLKDKELHTTKKKLQ